MKKLGPPPESPGKNLRHEKPGQRPLLTSNIANIQHHSDRDSQPLDFPPSTPTSPGAHNDDDLYPYLNTNTGRPHKKRRAKGPLPSTSPPPKAAGSQDSGIIKAQFKNGREPTDGSRPAAHDYARPTYNRLLRAIRDFETQIYTNKPFPEPDEQVTIALQCWRRVNAALEEEMEFTDRMSAIVGGYLWVGQQYTYHVFSQVSCRGSRARSHLVSVTRALIVEHYGFSRVTSAKSKLANSKKAEALLEDGAFHYKVRNLFCTA